MKKLTLIVTIIVCTFTVGCTKKVVQKPESLKDAYFDIAQRIENKEDVRINEVNKLLEEYTSKQEELNQDSSYNNATVQLYSFTNEKEKLMISDDGTEDEKVTDLAYFKEDGLNSITLGYGTSSNSTELLFLATVDDITAYEKICELVNSKDSKFSNIYHEISQNIATENTITINDIKNIINSEPTSEDSLDSATSKEITRYGFQLEDGGEVIAVYTLRGNESISRVTYASNDAIWVMKNTIRGELLTNGGPTIADVQGEVDDISIQKEIETLIFD